MPPFGEVWDAVGQQVMMGIEGGVSNEQFFSRYLVAETLVWALGVAKVSCHILIKSSVKVQNIAFSFIFVFPNNFGISFFNLINFIFLYKLKDQL